MGTLRNSYPRIPTGGLYHPLDLKAGEDILVECHLARLVGGSLFPADGLSLLLALDKREASELLLFLVLRERRPLWSRVAVRGWEVAEEMIPDSDLDALATTVSDPDRREALLLALGQRYDPSSNLRIGERGEEAVEQASKEELISAGHHDLADQVQRVSLVSDQLGYDVVAPTTTGGTRRMEVKTCGRLGRQIQVHISRNQVERSLRDRSWYLVVCALDEDEEVTIVGWCQSNHFKSLLPVDESPRARWTSVELALESIDLAVGLPPIEGAAALSPDSQIYGETPAR